MKVRKAIGTRIAVPLLIAGCSALACQGSGAAAGKGCSEQQACKSGLVCQNEICVEKSGSSGGASQGHSGGDTGAGGDHTTSGGGGKPGAGGSDDAGGDGGDGGANAGTGGEPSGDTISLYKGDGRELLSNPLGIQGSFFVFQDGYIGAEMIPADGYPHSEIYPITLDDESSQPIVNGKIGVVTTSTNQLCDPENVQDPCRWDVVYGAGLGVTLNTQAGTNLPWNASQAGVSGFSFKTTGQSGSSAFIFAARMEGSEDNFCKKFQIEDVSLNVTEKVKLSELTHNCEGHKPSTLTLDPTKLVELRWQVLPDITSGKNNLVYYTVERLETF